MTVPLRTGEEIAVNVALGTRSYDIVIGRGLLGSLGTKIAALRPGARAAIVSDDNVAKLRDDSPAANVATRRRSNGVSGAARQHQRREERRGRELLKWRFHDCVSFRSAGLASGGGAWQTVYQMRVCAVTLL